MRFSAFLAISLAAVPVWAGAPGAVYTSTNAAGGNSVIAYERAADGALSNARMYTTGGAGTGAGLGSQGAVTLSENGRWLFAVNAGSNDVTVFSVGENGLVWRSKTPSGGVTPISVAVSGDVVVVLNGGGTPNVSAFHLQEDGSLNPADSRNLNGSAPAEVAFNRDGTLLAVTEKASSTIDVFVVEDANLSSQNTQPSAGTTPFGFVFTKKDRLIVTEAAGGPGGTSAVTSYEANENGGLSPVTESLPDTQEATCWAVATDSGRYVFVANTHSGTVSSIAIDRTCALTLLNAVAGNTGVNSLPGDLALSDGSRFLYALTPGTATVNEFRVGPDGGLSAIGAAPGVPSSAAGLAAR